MLRKSSPRNDQDAFLVHVNGNSIVTISIWNGKGKHESTFAQVQVHRQAREDRKVESSLWSCWSLALLLVWWKQLNYKNTVAVLSPNPNYTTVIIILFTLADPPQKSLFKLTAHLLMSVVMSVVIIKIWIIPMIPNTAWPSSNSFFLCNYPGL